MCHNWQDHPQYVITEGEECSMWDYNSYLLQLGEVGAEGIISRPIK